MLDLAVQGVQGTLARPTELPAVELSVIERDGVRSKLRLDRSTGTLPLKYVKPDPNQPRQVDTHAPDFADLVSSIREHGVIQPITVRYVEGDDYFKIVAGERRYRAASAAGLSEIPAVVKDLDDTNAAIQQIEENLHRTNLNPLDEAAAIRRLMSAKDYTQRQVASKIHKPESYVSQLLAVEERLTRHEKAAIVKLRPDEAPGRTLIYAALRAPDPETRQALLFGKVSGKTITVAQARATLAEKKRRAGGRPRAAVVQISVEDIGAVVTIRFAKRTRVADDDVAYALEAARATFRRHERG
ncbi:MAG: ParB/RepB/Spo0J family partition protein [Candidatus Eisenbacteria bacterium]|uniref:ParB/RepB/Spo0J family partition protein n=1 Tax=Eiseniibacteriota bacterium TaxID=2212470 RepID=A0A849SRD7_UNCEI|nr:ParB/RepB/Spo0J family partition protein [Candidatus Eisenbacteria bacterium]